MKVLLLTTCICNDENIKNLHRLILSINTVTHTQFTHCLLLQNAEECNEDDLPARVKNYELIILRQNKLISLSQARNKLIAHAENCYGLATFDFVSCPDDDCWYPHGFWTRFLTLYNEHKFELLYTQFSSQPSQQAINKNKHSCANLIRFASSNTTFYNAEIFNKVGLFDESFGIGSKNNGGEDLDFAIKASLISKKVFFIAEATIGHRDPLPEFRCKYFQGSFAVLGNHKWKSLALYYHFLRKFMIGLVFFGQGKIRLADFKQVK
jgi:hypothetical protein